MCYTNVLYRRTGNALISLRHRAFGESRFRLQKEVLIISTSFFCNLIGSTKKGSAQSFWI